MSEFRFRAKRFVIAIAKQRLHLIRSSHKYRIHQSGDLRLIAERLINDFNLHVSDHTVALYILRNKDKIYDLIPKHSKFQYSERYHKLRQILSECNDIIEFHKNPQNLIR